VNFSIAAEGSKGEGGSWGYWVGEQKKGEQNGFEKD